MSFNRAFHKGANRSQIQNAMNPFQYLVPVKSCDDSKNELISQISIPHPVVEEVIRHEYRLEHQAVSAHNPQSYEWPLSSENRGGDDSV